MDKNFKQYYYKDWIKCFWIFLMIFQICLPATSQNIESDLIPQSPTAYSLGKYGDIPVEHYTGVPNINIPIYSLVDKDVSVDISLSYHGSGIKVDELASWVGLGWSLNTGGVITRVVRGRAERLLSDGTLTPTRTYIPFYTNGNKSHYISDYNLQAAGTNQTDNEPDIFYYNFDGASGRFHLDPNGEAILHQDDDIIIEFLYDAVSGSKFIITNKVGFKYEFSDVEKNSTMSNQHGVLVPGSFQVLKVQAEIQ